MLRRFAYSLGVTAVLVTACGGGADTSNPTAACNAYASAFCNKAQACGVPGANGSCAGQLQTALDCPHFACPAGTTFDSGAAKECVDGINGLSCTDAANAAQNGQLGAACSRICR